MTRFRIAKPVTLLVAGMAVMLTTDIGIAGPYPEKPINMWVGFRPGGAVDTTGRIVAERLAKVLGQPIVPVTKSGGGGTVMATQLAKAAPDGYTIGMGASAAFTLTPQLNKKITYKIEDFEHIATLTYPTDAVVVRADAKWKTLDDMLKDSKASGKPISIAVQVAVSRMMCMVLADKSGAKFNFVPVRGGSAGVQQVLGGHVDTMWSGSGWTEQVRAGKMRPLATISTERLKEYPDVPTLIELGYNYTFTDTFMFSLPKGVPPAIVKTLADAVQKVMSDPEVQKSLYDKFKLNTKYRGSAETLAFLKKQRADVAPLVAKLDEK
jgi:tripartite-type tricarboxylate transporter receptor subunit TctC